VVDFWTCDGDVEDLEEVDRVFADGECGNNVFFADGKNMKGNVEPGGSNIEERSGGDITGKGKGGNGSEDIFVKDGASNSKKRKRCEDKDIQSVEHNTRGEVGPPTGERKTETKT
jgi:hypothetical protein